MGARRPAAPAFTSVKAEFEMYPRRSDAQKRQPTRPARGASPGMTLIELLLGLVFAAFCLGLAWSILTRAEGWWRLLAMLAALPGIYLLAFAAFYLLRWRHTQPPRDTNPPR